MTTRDLAGRAGPCTHKVRAIGRQGEALHP